jgi:A-macroglobulin TED domain/Alpha-2-macroglobulin family/MG2 domain/A-macroglobulin receptor binding domain/Alpha-2-macroglobulin bait region domain/Carboxypeptidase regulatory-like domain
METFRGHSDPSRTRPFTLWFILLSIVVTAAIVISTQPSRATQPSAATNEETVVATHSHGALHVTIPYEAKRSGAGRLTVEVLDPEDQVLGREKRQIEIAAGKGHWQEQIKLEKPLADEDLVWQRLRYRFEYGARKDEALEGTESIAQILRTPVVHIMGQQVYLSGGRAAVRVIVTDSRNEVIAGPGTVRIEFLVPQHAPRVLFTGRLNRRGTTEAQFRFPTGLVGNEQLHYVVDTPIGSTEFTQAVRLEDKVSILLTTEKPIYQPGQTIHVRALALDRASHEAAASGKLIFEVEDSRGNKVFKKATQTDKFGIASAEFELADEVNLGTYHLRALMGETEAAPTNSAEIALNVEKYILPKFKVAIDFAGKENKTKHGYRPGDHVTGTVRANYFFGKPVENGEISVKASALDVSVFEAAAAQGKTDRDGAYHFDLKLPNYFAGRPLSQGAARVLIEAKVKDSAGHDETRGEPITVSEAPFVITAVPEGGTLAPNLENQVFILTSYPDGTPAKTNLKIQLGRNAEQRIATDDGGVAEIRLNAGAGNETPRVEATDGEGNRASSNLPLDARQGQEQILLRTERAVYRAGERIQLKVFSTRKRGSAYVDIVKEGQTVLTRDVDIENGQAELAVTATPEMAGTLDFNAFLFGSDARPVADHRLVFVQPADELKIDATSDASVYKPGAEARIRFRVTNARGEGVSAALGVQVVDEAVFALAEKQPGFAKVFFYLEQEVLKPRYEIHSIGMPEIVEPFEESKLEQKDRAARALFAATEIVTANKFETQFGGTIPRAKYAEYARRYQARFVAQVRRISQNLEQGNGQNSDRNDMARLIAGMTADGASDLHDAWGTPMRIEPGQQYLQTKSYTVRSAGPDKKFGTADDLATVLTVQSRKLVGGPTSGPNAIDVRTEHEWGAFNGREEISGTAVDQWGGAMAGAAIVVRSVPGGIVRTMKANSDGQFIFVALPPAEYEIQVSTGSETVSRKIRLDARDHAVLSAFLRQEPNVTVVAVSDEIQTFGNHNFGTLEDGTVRDLPLNGRDFQQLAQLREAEAMPRSVSQSVTVTAAAPQIELTNATLGGTVDATLAKKDDHSGAANPHVRSYFPEALYINPEIITDADGRASITVSLADSITTWRMAMLASTSHGALGSGTSSLKVFQDFFVDLDLPVTLTQGDRVSIPVGVYNYSGARGNVGLQLREEDWFSLVDDVAEKSVEVDSARVGGSQFTLEAKRIGKFKLTLTAQMNGGSRRADIVVREIEVIPNGREQDLVFNGRLDSGIRQELNFPADSIADASKIFVRLYPGPLSQVIEGMDSILQMPGGCFEQTSSSTYPNVLALDYMKRTKKLTPEVHAKAEGYIANGYQRLLTFEVPGGGFSWFGSAPANKILTAYGLMEFYDMSKVHDVDSKLILRTQEWLAGQQQADGSWKPDASFINEGATNRYNSDLLRITAYIAWSLENTGYQGPAVESARNFIETHINAKIDAYTLAVVANFAADYGKDRDFTRQAMRLLLDARIEKDDQIWWSADETGMYATGASASVETTGLAVQALLKWGEASDISRKAISYIASKKDSSGTWGTTQATIMALRSLLLATEKGAADVRGAAEVILNGKSAGKIVLTADNSELFHQFAFKGDDAKASNTVEIKFEGKGGLAYQVAGRYFLPWDKKPENEALSIDVAYDRAHLAQDDVATATATIKNNLPKSANMVMVDLGIPPGFDLLSEDLQDYQSKSAGRRSGRLEKFSLTATQAILYFDAIAARDAITLHFRLRAKYPIRARTFQSRVYEYYDPAVSSLARPTLLEVRKR